MKFSLCVLLICFTVVIAYPHGSHEHHSDSHNHHGGSHNHNRGKKKV